MKFTAIKSEGGLIPYDILEKIYSGEVTGQAARDFQLENTTVLDEISKSWKAARTFWNAFQLRLNRLKPEDSTVRDTREQWIIPLLETLGFPKITYFAKAEEVAGKTYAISHRATENKESFPIHIVGIKDNLDKRSESGRPRLSPHSLMQEFLNHTENLWGVVTNGWQLRLLRDSSKISRPIFIEFDLQQILEQEKFNEFALLFRLVHFSRLPKHQDDSTDCFIEKYYNEAVNTGGRVRDKLRDGVEESLKIFGNGFINHPENSWLREAIIKNEVHAIEYYRQLLKLVYRLLFLMVSEERNLVGPTDPQKEPIYFKFYSVNRLRELSHSFIPGLSKPFDLWENLLVTFKLYSDEGYGEKLSIAPLNGDLFGTNAIPLFEKCKLYNKDLLDAIKQISQYEDNGNKRRINYLALDVEELGSVYESLLDFHPVMQVHDESNIEFQLVFGSERKTTGSYYTNHDLVHELIQSALVPLIKRVTEKQISDDQKVKELLNLKVCDPAAGSGHFLLAAARRIAEEVAKIRSGEDYPTPTEYNIAKRDVIQRCIYGVDLNPLAVDLCKLALWLEGHTKGKPLSFLDHRIKNGNALIGAFSYEQIKKGIPDEAFNAVTGDDKEVGKYFKKRNKEERTGGTFDLFGPRMSVATENEIKFLASGFSQFDNLSIETTEDYHKAEDEFIKLKRSAQWLREWHMANIWTYAFFAPLTDMNDRTVPTYEQLLDYMANPNSPNAKLIGKADESAMKNKFFHWFLEFPEVFAKGGFDCILGNPPWEKIQPEEQQYFASRNPVVALANGNDRKKMIKKLEKTNPFLFQDWMEFKKEIENQSIFIRNSHRYLYSNEGKINTYSLFTELGWQLMNNLGQGGLIVQTGIATDDSNKKLFMNLIQGKHLVSFIDFENKEALFPSVHREQRFCLLTITNIINHENQTKFAFWLSLPQQLEDDYRFFELGREEISLLSPNTGNCPMFRSRNEAEIVLKMYRDKTVLVNDVTPVNNWPIEFCQFVNMTSDSENFIDRINKKKIKEEELVKLYEGKLTHQFDHRYTTFENVDEDNYQKGNPRIIMDLERQNENFQIQPRYWLHKSYFDSIYSSLNWNHKWFLSFHSITNPNNERTSIFSIIPLSGVGNSSPIIISNRDFALLAVLCSVGNSFPFDFVARRRIASRNFNFFILKQLPIIKKEILTMTSSLIRPTVFQWIIIRVLELSFTSRDLEPFAKDCGYNGPPFIWNEERRFLIRCELDALYFKLYGLNREEVDYVMETFPIVKRKDVEKYSDYRTKNTILEIFDEMLECEKQGKQYQTRLDPPPADPRVAHRE